MRTIRRSTDLLEGYIGDELLALHEEKGQTYGFNEPLTFIWQLLVRPREIGELRSELLSRFEVDPETLETDLEYGLRRLKDVGLIEISDTDT